MSTVSISEFTFGSLTSPFSSAAGWPGSKRVRKAVRSMATRPISTTFASRSRSKWRWKLGTLRRYGSAPGLSAVESALAMFSAMTRMRPDWALRPEAATEIVLRKSMSQLSPAADSRAQHLQALLVERCGKLVVGLVLRHLQHLVLEADGVAARSNLEAVRVALVLSGPAGCPGEVVRIGAHGRESAPGGGAVRRKRRHAQVLRLKARRWRRSRPGASGASG